MIVGVIPIIRKGYRQIISMIEKLERYKRRVEKKTGIVTGIGLRIGGGGENQIKEEEQQSKMKNDSTSIKDKG